MDVKQIGARAKDQLAVYHELARNALRKMLIIFEIPLLFINLVNRISAVAGCDHSLAILV